MTYLDLDLSVFNTFIFDCDGVILNSNRVKSEAFRKAVIDYGNIEANELVRYNEEYGGISRKDKIRHFFENILKVRDFEDEAESVLDKFSEIVKSELGSCELSGSIVDLRSKYKKTRWFVVSGGDEMEIEDALRNRGIIHFFEKIYGGPKKKAEIFESMKMNGDITFPAIYFGDSKYDYQSADGAGLSFLFVSGWTDFHDWKGYCEVKGVQSVESLEDLL